MSVLTSESRTDSGLGIIPLIIAGVAAGASMYQGNQEKKAQEKAAKEQAKAQAAAQRAAIKAEKLASRRTMTIAIVGGSALVIGVGIWLLVRKRRK